MQNDMQDPEKVMTALEGIDWSTRRMRKLTESESIFFYILGATVIGSIVGVIYTCILLVVDEKVKAAFMSTLVTPALLIFVVVMAINIFAILQYEYKKLKQEIIKSGVRINLD
ncbi:hypothetical protein E8E11_003506 [Didymella keratinophila]|nr:hypothetical protein E8E11_003506 [Didymella keratinophila]